MTVQLSMFDLMTSPDSSECISSPALEGGITPSDWRDGPLVALSGLDPVPANPSRSPAPRKASRTSVTSGPSSETLSLSDVLQQSLESRLRALLNGSDLCEVTWKPWATPWGRSLSKPRARVRTIYGTDTGSWPMPTTRDHKDGGYCPNVPFNGLLGRTVWQTPVADDAVDRIKGKINSRGEPKLSGQAIATWPSPTSQISGDTPEAHETRQIRVVAKHGRRMGTPLTVHAQVASNGLSEPTEKRGALSPIFVAWLMGYPKAWVDCGASISPKRRKG